MIKFEKGELVKCTWHIGIGVILDIISIEHETSYIRKLKHEPMALVYWWFPKPLRQHFCLDRRSVVESFLSLSDY